MLILASNSQRRIKLLSDIGLTFKTIVNEVSEEVEKNLRPHEIVETLSKRKAQAAFEKHPKDTIIAADTIVYLDGEVIGKPKDEDEAFLMLKNYQDKNIMFILVLLLLISIKKTFYSQSEVYMKQLNDIQIYEYLEQKNHLKGRSLCNPRKAEN